MKILKSLIIAISLMVNSISIASSQTLSSTDNANFHQQRILKNASLVSKPSYGGTLVWGTINSPTVINPILTTTSVSASLLSLLFDYLIRINSRGEIIPDLAERWEVSRDGLEYIFYLTPNIKFHDGVECTAEDVVFTYLQYINPKNQSPYRSNFDLIKSVTAIDTHKVRIILNQRFPAFLYKLSEMEIVPKHILENEILNQSAFNYKPIGTGPFQIKNWNKQTNEIDLIANRSYFQGRPYLDGINVKIYKDTAHLWAAFMRQEIDLVKFIAREDYLLIKEDPAFKGYKIPFEYYAIVYNLGDPVFFDKDVRRSIAYGINVDEIIDLVFSGDGIKSMGPFNPATVSSGRAPEIISYNPAKAKLELGSRGWVDINGDGVREKAGKRLIMNLLVDGRKEADKKIAMLVRQQLSQIGVQVKIQLYDGEKEINERVEEFSHSQAWLRFMSGQKFKEYESVRDWYSLSTESGKIWTYKNEEVDRLFKLMRVTNDEVKRKEIYHEISSIIYTDQPACFLFFPVTYHAISSKFKQTDEYFTIEMPTYTIKDWCVVNK